jgi:hypothetical protein
LIGFYLRHGPTRQQRLDRIVTDPHHGIRASHGANGNIATNKTIDRSELRIAQSGHKFMSGWQFLSPVRGHLSPRSSPGFSRVNCSRTLLIEERCEVIFCRPSPSSRSAGGDAQQDASSSEELRSVSHVRCGTRSCPPRS